MKNALRFLIVDGDNVDAMALRRRLDGEKAGHTIDVAASLHEAKKKLVANHYDLVILDLELPDSHGLDGVIDLQALAPEIAMVVVSGNKDQQVALRAMGVGAEDFIEKESLALENFCRAADFAIERHRRKRRLYRDMDSMRLSLDEAMLQAHT